MVSSATCTSEFFKDDRNQGGDRAFIGRGGVYSYICVLNFF